MTYFDHSATTPMHPQVIDTMSQLMKEVYGNPSSVHGYGRQAHEHLETARQVIAKSLHVRAHEIIFNAGGTEADNTALISTALTRQKEGKHIITTQVEHSAILQSAIFLESQGFEVTYLPVDSDGMIHVSEISKALRADTILVSVMFANNETGNVFPIAEIGKLLRNHPAYFHTDAVQAYGKLSIDPVALGIDLLSVSGHKINGPKGTGFLYKRDGIQLNSLIHGGEQEEKRRAGTENLISICGMAEAVNQLMKTDFVEQQQNYQQFSDRLLARLDQSQISYHLNGYAKSKLSHVINLSFSGVSNNLLLMHLDLAGIAVSTGSACTAGNVEPSHVLIAMYGDHSPYINESVRISFGMGNTLEEVDALAEKLISTIQRIKK